MNNRGFSLPQIAIAVVFALLLLFIFIPMQKKAKAKARQNEARVLLAQFHTAAQTSKSELMIYSGNFVSMNYNPTGNLHYRITSKDNSVSLPPETKKDATCIDTSQACTGFKKWTEDFSDKIFKPAPPITAAETTDTLFKVTATATIRDERVDEWTIDQNKDMKNTHIGY